MVILIVDGVTVNVTRTVVPTTLTPAERAALTGELAKRTEREWLAAQRGNYLAGKAEAAASEARRQREIADRMTEMAFLAPSTLVEEVKEIRARKPYLIESCINANPSFTDRDVARATNSNRTTVAQARERIRTRALDEVRAMSVTKMCAVYSCNRKSQVHKMCGAHYGRMNSRKVSYEEALNFSPIGVPDAPKAPPTAGRPSRLSDRFND